MKKHKKHSLKDPHAKRESSKYSNPIASRELILETLDKAPAPLKKEDLAVALGIDDDEAYEALRRRLNAMERDGQIHSNRKRAYACVDKLELISGRIQAHRDGFGFLIPAEGGDDIYLPYRQMRKVFDGDDALVRLTPSGVKGRRDGKIVEVLRRNTQQIVGRYFNESGVGFVKPDNPRLSHDILVAPEHAAGASDNQFVIVDISQYPTTHSPAMGVITEVLGDHMAPGMEIDVAIRAHNLPHEWPDDVQQQAKQLPTVVDENDKLHRVDLRDKHFVTIDGEDARDFDDAVYCTPRKSGGWTLYVAIADVSHYVGLGSALDKEAELRSTSVYFPDFVLPMLPEALSNGLCSLNPKVDRLAMVCEMNISASGRVTAYQFYEGLIYSHARLTYTKVGKMIGSGFASLSEDEQALAQQEQQELRAEYAHVAQDVDHLYDLYHVLRGIREHRGAIDFETTETRIIFDEQRKIERIIPVVRNDAHKLIEECMLCANVCAAKFLEKHELDGLYRVHEGPKEQKLENLQSFLAELGLKLSVQGKPEPSHYQRLIAAIAQRPDAKVIQTVMLRSLRQAVYQPDNQGHFGLAYPAYTHFTSPIRRYPDLLTHRALRHVIRSRKYSEHVQRVKGAKIIPKKIIYPYDMADMLRLGEHTSMAERRADDATRDVVGWLKCEFLQDRIGEVFPGVITAVTNFGVFVELLDVYVEGLIHITSLPSDYYRFDEAHHRLVGERSRRIFCLGDELTVQVAAVKLDDRKVDFELVDLTQTARKKHKDNLRKHKKSSAQNKKSVSKKRSKPESYNSFTSARSENHEKAKPLDSVREKLRKGDFSGLDANSDDLSKGRKKTPSKRPAKAAGSKKLAAKTKVKSAAKSKLKSKPKTKSQTRLTLKSNSKTVSAKKRTPRKKS